MYCMAEFETPGNVCQKCCHGCDGSQFSASASAWRLALAQFCILILICAYDGGRLVELAAHIRIVLHWRLHQGLH